MRGITLLLVCFIASTFEKTVLGVTCPDGLPCEGGACCRKLFLGRSHDCCRSGYQCVRSFGIGACVVSGPPKKEIGIPKIIPEEQDYENQERNILNSLNLIQNLIDQMDGESQNIPEGQDYEQQEKNMLQFLSAIEELAHQSNEKIIPMRTDISNEEDDEDEDDEETQRGPNKLPIRRAFWFFKILVKLIPKILPKIIPKILPKVIPKILPKVIPKILPKVIPPIVPETSRENIQAMDRFISAIGNHD
ncbi:uncharacterized protein [Parasteatoda tepidariorum]|uniref:uncharacterized protein n=1 Tax=Parasteatoda tepidariorum TaxID=114398 RepID=UPI001C723077|nr:uncharacterized protein LOC107456065 isoform X1 [Parasteatoda tepidariorum]